MFFNMWLLLSEEECLYCLGRQGNVNGYFCYCGEDFMGKNYLFDEGFKWRKPCVEDAEVKYAL